MTGISRTERHKVLTRLGNIGESWDTLGGISRTEKVLENLVIRLLIKVAEHSFLTPMHYLSLFSNHWQLGSQNWQGASSTKKVSILICFIGLLVGTITMATQLVVNQH